MRDFLAFEGHLKGALGRLGRPIPDEWYELPAYYKGMPDTVIGPEEEIPWPAWTERLDHELELAAVIGRRCRDVAAEEADELHLRLHDLERRLGARHPGPRAAGRHGPGQGEGLGRLERARPVPRDGGRARCGRPADEGPGQRRALGRRHQRLMHYSFADMIAYASRSQTLYPGELFGSGTATGGSGLELDRRLSPGDLVELEIEGIGVLRNRIGAKGEA